MHNEIWSRLQGLDCVALSIEGNVSSNNLEVYPNPVSGQLYVRGLEGKPVKLQLYNILGKEVRQSSSASLLGLENLFRGVYLLRITVDGEAIIKKVVLE